MIIHCKTYIYIYKSINKSSSRVDCRERWEANVDGEIIRSEEKSGEKQPVLLRAQWRRISLLRSLSASDDGAPASLLHWRSDPPSSRCSSQCVCVRARVCRKRGKGAAILLDLTCPQCLWGPCEENLVRGPHFSTLDIALGTCTSQQPWCQGSVQGAELPSSGKENWGIMQSGEK